METLPYELVGQIGAFLAAKWRCRLFICTKLWYVQCYDDLLRWRKNINGALNEIAKIDYKCVEYFKPHTYVQYSIRKYGDNYITYTYMYTYIMVRGAFNRVRLVFSIDIENMEYEYVKHNKGRVKMRIVGDHKSYVRDIKKIKTYERLSKEKAVAKRAFNKYCSADSGFIVIHI
jgi:hypothetical protein